MRYTNLIWDFDGMLFNTYPRMAKAFSQALTDLGVSVPDHDVMRRIKRSVGRACSDYAGQFGLSSDEISRLYHLHEHAMPPEDMFPYEGIAELISDSAREGVRHYLYTHRDHTAFLALEAHSLRRFFSDAVTIEDHFPSKPAPDALLSLMSRNSLNPADCLMLGDRDIDILAARNAGIAGCLFDPEHFYDSFANKLRTDSAAGLRKLLGLTDVPSAPLHPAEGDSNNIFV